MDNTINTKHARIILDVVRKNYKDTKFEITEIDTISDSIVKKTNIDVAKTAITEYLNKFVHMHNDGTYYLNPEKRKRTAKKINVTKNVDTGKLTIVETEVVSDANVVNNKEIVITTETITNTQTIDETASDDTQKLIMELDNMMALEKEQSINKPQYLYPIENPYDIVKKTEDRFNPSSSQWIHEEQIDDKLNEITELRTQKLHRLMQIEYPEQRSPEWFKMREGKITASDIGTVIDCNKHEQQYKFIIKKIITVPFPGNKFVYHGKKLEKIATMIYEYRMNVKMIEFGLIGHYKYPFLGASPDGIVSEYKFNGKNKTALVGRMLEIKCPLSRKINKTGEIIDNICPIYYYAQVLQQLECCDLDECDFWQCDIREYNSREEFINDTCPTEPFRSKETGYEKGVLIQLIPKEKAVESTQNYLEVIWDHSQHIYPDEIEMTPYECDQWVLRKMEEIKTKPEYAKVFFDKVIYWKLNDSHCEVIKRDKNWFAKNFPTMNKMWKYVEFFRANKDKFEIFQNYIDSLNLKYNTKIMKVAELLASQPASNNALAMKQYKDKVQTVLDDIAKNNTNKKNKVTEYEYSKDTTEESSNFNPKKYCF